MIGHAASITFPNVLEMSGSGEIAMRNVQVDGSGELHCWNCGASAFTQKRTFRSKALVGVGAFATRKKLQCQVCHKYNDVGTADRYEPAKKALPVGSLQRPSVSGRTEPELTELIEALVDKYEQLPFKCSYWQVQVYDDALLVHHFDEWSSNELVVPYDELVGSFFRPPCGSVSGLFSLLIRSAPEPPATVDAGASDVYSLEFGPAQRSAVKRLDDLVGLVAERNLMLAEGDLVPPLTGPISEASEPDESVVERLEALAELHRRGLISDRQFEVKQQAIIDEM